MIVQSELRVTERIWRMLAGNPDTWQFKMESYDLGHCETSELDIDTTHKTSGGIVIVEWMPYQIFADPMEFIRHREQKKRVDFFA